jgi:hypothetical protein
MEDIRIVLNQYRPKNKTTPDSESRGMSPKMPSTSEIPDLFFDEILVQFKLSRPDILVLMYLYRHVWCRPNIFKEYGIGPVHAYSEMCHALHMGMDDLQTSLRHLESHQFIETIRAGQYFVRKYFTSTNDAIFGQSYNDFA